MNNREENKKPIVLVAEDTDSNYLLISAILKKEYKIEWAHDGIEAVNMCQKLNPSLILMDIRMPHMDGLTATAAIRKTNQIIPIIAVTAFAFEKDRIEAIKAGCTDFLTKPITASTLKEKIFKALNP